MAKKQHGDTAVLDRPKKFSVVLHANTPLAHESAVIEAENGDEAWSKFCAMNGISDSTCEREISEVTE